MGLKPGSRKEINARASLTGRLRLKFCFYPQNNEKPLKNFKQENNNHTVLLHDHSMQRADYKGVWTSGNQ